MTTISRRGLLGLGLGRALSGASGEVAHRPAFDPVALQARLVRAWDGATDTGLWEPAARHLVAAAAPLPGEQVLDAAAGEGAVACLAAARGAAVTACDVAPRRVARGRDRTAAVGLPVLWLHADLERLPFADGAFDRALSGFGPMFCLGARDAVGELFRVVRPGGVVAFSAWSAGGAVGRLLRLAARHERLPAAIPPPLAWGREERLRQDLEPHADEVVFATHELTLRFASRQDAADRLTGALGPLAAVAARLDDEARAALRAEVLSVLDELGGAVVPARCLVVRARARP